MNSPTQTTEIIDIILKFVGLQKKIISTFRQSFPNVTDEKYLLDCPRSGYLEVQGEQWKFQKHGVGVCFIGQKSSKVVDVHIGIFSNPKVFDSWRLHQYFDSIGLDRIDYLSDVFDVCDEDETENLLKYLLKDGLIISDLDKQQSRYLVQEKE